jgi:hypothetical protein
MDDSNNLLWLPPEYQPVESAVKVGSDADRVQFKFLTSARMSCATINDETLSYFPITLVERGDERA